MVITSPAKIAMMKRNQGEEPTLAETIDALLGDVDIVLTEGFKKSSMPKIEVNRRERSATLLCHGVEHDPTLIAVASDMTWNLDVPVFGIDDAAAICDFIVERFLR
jgi:molybdopterin-guanine dinucleotide biosynthesis protein MobB